MSFCCSEVWCRFGPCPGESLLHPLPVIDSFCIVPYSPCLMGWMAFVTKGFVLIFKVVWPHVGADLVKTACPLLLLWHLWQNLLVQASIYRAETPSPHRYHLYQTLLNLPGMTHLHRLLGHDIDTDFQIQFDSDSKVFPIPNWFSCT